MIMGIISQGYSQCIPIIGSNPDITKVCEDLTIQFLDNSTCPSSLARNWNFGDGTATSNVQNPSHSFSAGVTGDTTYTVTLEKEYNGSWVSTQKLVTVYKKPAVSFNVSKLTACIIIDTLQFTNTSPMPFGTSLSWDFGDGSALSASPTPTHTYTSAEKSSYITRLSVTNTNNCVSIASKTIIVNEIPNPNFTMNTNTGCDPLTVTATNTTVEGAFPITKWSWNFGGQGTSILKDPTEVTLTGANIYGISLSATNSAGCTNTTTNNLVVKKTPTVSFNLPVSVCVADTANVIYTGDGDPTASYSWSFPNSQSATGNAFGPYKVTYASAGQRNIILEVTENGCAKKDTTTIAVNSLPVVSLTSNDLDNLICEGAEIVFSAQPSGYGKYIFYNQGVEVQNGASATYQTTGLLSPNSLTVIAEDGNLCRSLVSNSIVTNVSPEPITTISTPSTSICDNDVVTITATGAFDKYTFLRGFLVLQEGPSPVLKTTLLSDGDQVTAYATNNTCEGRISNTLTFTETKRALKPILNCAGATADSITVVWNDDPSISSYELSVDNAPFYSPVSRNTEKVAIGINDTVRFKVSGNTVAPCWESLVSDNIYCLRGPYKPISFVTNPSVSACEGDIVNLSIGSLITASSHYGISWDGGPFSKDLTYQLTASSSRFVTVEMMDSIQKDAPTFKYSIALNVQALPKATILSKSSNLCEGLLHTFTADTAGYDKYQYFLNGKLVQDSAYHVYSNNSLPPEANQLILKTTNKGCVSKDTLDFNIVPKVTAVINASSSSICEGDVIDYTAVGDFDYYIFKNTLTGEIIQDSTIKVMSTNSVLDVTLVTKDEFGCLSNSANAQVSSTALPVVTILASKPTGSTICENEKVIFTAASGTGTSFDFYDNYQLVKSGLSSTYLSDSIAANHNYFVRAKLNGCIGASSDTITYAVSDTLEKPQVYCGTSDNGSIEILWDAVPKATGYEISVNNAAFHSPSSGVTGLSHTVTGLSSPNSIVARVIATGALPCGNSIISDSVKCYLPCSGINFTQNFVTKEACVGDSLVVSISNITGGTGIYNILWDGVPGLASNKIKVNQDTIIHVAVSDNSGSNCTPTKKTFKIKVNKVPTVSLAANSTYCSDEVALLQASPKYYDNYQFFDRLLPISNGINPTAIDSTVEDGHYYYVVATNKNCRDTSNVINISVSPKLSIPNINCGESSPLTVTFEWSDVKNATGYEISINGFPYKTPSSGSNGQFDFTGSLNAGDAVWAKVRAIGDAPCITSEASPIITCVAKPCGRKSFVISNDTTICEGESITVNLTGIQSPSTQYFFSWDGGATYGRTLSQTYTVKSDTTITVAMVDSTELTCPSTVMHMHVKVNKAPVFNLILNNLNDSSCAGEILTISPSVQGFDKYTYSIDGVQVHNSILSSYSTNSLAIGTHTISGSAVHNSCVYSAANKVNEVLSFPPLTFVSSDKNDTICTGEALVFTGSPGFDKYDFLKNGISVQKGTSSTFATSTLADGDVISLVANTYGQCYRTSQDIKTKVLPIPKFKLTSSDADNKICDKELVNFTIRPLPVSYKPFNNNIILGTDLSSITDSTFSMNNLKSSDKIYVLATNGGCTAPSNTIQTTVNDRPNVILSPKIDSICIGSSKSYSATSTTAGANYEWSTTDTGASITSTTATGSSIIYAPTTSSYLWVQAKDGSCTSFPDSAKIYVDDNPVIASAGLDQTICRYESLKLNASGGQSYHWVRGDSIENPFLQSTTVTPLKTSIYRVIVSNLVCRDSADVTITVDKCLTELPSKLPQVITPNGDGSNDALIFTDIDYFPNAKLTVYNRWSSIVFEGEHYNNDWKGTTTNGSLLPDGTYFYVLELGNGREPYTNYIMIQR